MKTGNGKGGAGDDYQGSSMCSAADTGPSTKMANRGGADGRARGVRVGRKRIALVWNMLDSKRLWNTHVST